MKLFLLLHVGVVSVAAHGHRPWNYFWKTSSGDKDKPGPCDKDESGTDLTPFAKTSCIDLKALAVFEDNPFIPGAKNSVIVREGKFSAIFGTNYNRRRGHDERQTASAEA